MTVQTWCDMGQLCSFGPRIEYGAGSSTSSGEPSSGQSPSPQPSPVEGEGVRAPSLRHAQESQAQGSHPHPGSLPSRGESPSPQPSPVEGEGGSPIPSTRSGEPGSGQAQSSPQWGQRGIAPARPPLWIPASYRVRGRLFAGMTVVQRSPPYRVRVRPFGSAQDGLRRA